MLNFKLIKALRYKEFCSSFKFCRCFVYIYCSQLSPIREGMRYSIWWLEHVLWGCKVEQNHWHRNLHPHPNHLLQSTDQPTHLQLNPSQPQILTLSSIRCNLGHSKFSCLSIGTREYHCIFFIRKAIYIYIYILLVRDKCTLFSWQSSRCSYPFASSILECNK